MADEEAGHGLASATGVAVLAAGAGLLGPVAGAAATALTPALETVLSGVLATLIGRTTKILLRILSLLSDCCPSMASRYAATVPGSLPFRPGQT